MPNFSVSKEGIRMTPCIFSTRRGNSLYPFPSPSLVTQPIAMLSALKAFYDERHKFSSPPLMGISLLLSHGVNCCAFDWCWTKMGCRRCPPPSCWLPAVPLPWWRRKNCLSNSVFLLCHLGGWNCTPVAWRGHGRPSAGRAALLCHTILNTGDRDLSGRRRHPTLQPPPSPARRCREAETCWWCRAGEDMGTEDLGGGGCAGDIEVVSKVGVILIDVPAPGHNSTGCPKQAATLQQGGEEGRKGPIGESQGTLTVP